MTPKLDRKMPRLVQRAFARAPFTQRWARKVNTGLLELIMVAGVLHYRRAKVFNRGAERIAKRHLRRQVKDPELRRKLTPDYSFGCKRPTFSNDYYRDVHQGARSTSRPFRSRGSRPPASSSPTAASVDVDVLVLATGFDMWDANFPAIRIVGRDGKDLGQWWRSTRFQAYQGIAVPGFPNLLSLASPYSYSGLSFFTTIEGQMKHMDRLLTEVRRRDARTFEVTDPANEEFLGWVTERLGDSVFALGSCATARSYYFNQHGEAALLRPTSTINTHQEAQSFPLDDYELRVTRRAACRAISR